MNNILIKSISYDENEILNNIIKLHCKTNIELDATFSKGNFYKGKVKEPIWKFDLYPQVSGVVKADCRDLSNYVKDGCINTLIFDPPFLATKGKSLDINNQSNKINKRFGIYPTEKELHQFYIDTLKEFYRILKKRGIVIFKCQDYTDSKTTMTHCHVFNWAEQNGFYAKDVFILFSKNRIFNPNVEQRHSRKFHSYYWVFQKP